jgi:dihydropteroate synthase
MTASNSQSTDIPLCLNGFRTCLRPHAIMGILNLTPDSFSDGGQYPSVEKALAAAGQMIAEGADILDLGGESTRPGSDPVSVETELQRVMPVLEALPKDRVLISVDSCKPEVQAAALAAGAHIINDISGGSDTLFELAQTHQAGLILMHTPAPPKTMQAHTDYDDVLECVANYLSARIQRAKEFNIPALWSDPGIGFGKTLEQNLQLMRNLDRFRLQGCGVLLGASRKSWIGHLTGAQVDQRLPASLVALTAAVSQGVEIIRVHDVAASVQARKAAEALFRSPNA